MSADETTPTETAAEETAAAAASATDEGPPQTGDGQQDDGAAKKNGGKTTKRANKNKNEVPIEELYDLTKPIKRIERPSKEAHEAAIAAIDNEIETLKSSRNDLQSKIDLALGSNKNKNTPISRERGALNKLKNRKGLMIEQKRQIRTKLEIVKAKTDRLVGDSKNARSGIKFTNVSDIDKEISKLQRKQETSSMSLADEKRLIKEIESLQASRRNLEELKSKQGDLDSLKLDRKAIQAELTAKDKEINAIQKEIDAQTKVLKNLTDQQSGQRGEMGKLVEERNSLKSQMDEKFKEKARLRTQFHKETNEWYNNQRAVKAQRQLQYQEEKKRRDEEHAAWLKKKEEEELKKTPYEEEMALCDYLADYLQKTYLVESQAVKIQRAENAEQKAKSDVVVVKDDPFAGFKAVNKKDEEEIYFGKAKGESGGKKKSKANKNGKSATFSVNLDLWEQFGLLNLTPPTSLEKVADSVEELKQKKVWYSEQPRGSVPTAKDIRKANNEENAKFRSNQNQKANSKGDKKPAIFSISSDEFAPLGGPATVSVDGSTWGK